MKRLLPRTLFGQMLLIMLAGVLISLLVGTAIYASDRARAVRAIGGYAATQRIANLVRLLNDAPPAWRERIAEVASDATLRVTLSSTPPAFVGTDDKGNAGAVRRYLAEQLPAALANRLYVAVVAPGVPLGGGLPPPGPGSGFGPAAAPGAMPAAGPTGLGDPGPFVGGMSMSDPAAMREHMRMMMGYPPPGVPPWMTGGAGRWPRLQAAVQLSDGQWLSFATVLPNATPSAPWPFMAAMATMAVVIVLASARAVRRVTAPLRVLAGAAERLGRDVNAPPVGEAGTLEMRQAAQSFNRMQERIRRLLDNRTRMLAALSHDLRTPLTLLRLRTEGLEQTEDRDRMLATIGDLDAMVGASLDFARGQAVAEPWRRTDVAALVGSIADDMADAGLPVTMAPAEAMVLECQPGALRRAVTNLLDNAVKFGGSARAAITAAGTGVRIDIDDDGPGIPEADQARVFEPFHRLEQSRSRETGGTGLGLSIAQSIVQAHGGEIVLANRPEGGLRASVVLPS